MSDSEMTPKLTDEESAELFKQLKKQEMPKSGFELFEQMKKRIEQEAEKGRKP